MTRIWWPKGVIPSRARQTSWHPMRMREAWMWETWMRDWGSSPGNQPTWFEVES